MVLQYQRNNVVDSIYEETLTIKGNKLITTVVLPSKDEYHRMISYIEKKNDSIKFDSYRIFKKTYKKELVIINTTGKTTPFYYVKHSSKKY